MITDNIIISIQPERQPGVSSIVTAPTVYRYMLWIGRRSPIILHSHRTYPSDKAARDAADRAIDRLWKETH